MVILYHYCTVLYSTVPLYYYTLNYYCTVVYQVLLLLLYGTTIIHFCTVMYCTSVLLYWTVLKMYCMLDCSVPGTVLLYVL